MQRPLLLLCICCSFKMFLESLYLLEIQNSAIIWAPYFKRIPLCNYTFLTATVEALETFLETILWKYCQFFQHILNNVSSITKVLSLQFWFQSREQVKISLSQVRRVSGMLHIFTVFVAEKFLTKSDQCVGALSWRRYQLLVLHFLGHFLVTASLRHWRMLMCISVFKVAIPVNYTSKFGELFEATMWVHKLQSLRVNILA